MLGADSDNMHVVTGLDGGNVLGTLKAGGNVRGDMSKGGGECPAPVIKMPQQNDDSPSLLTSVILALTVAFRSVNIACIKLCHFREIFFTP